MCGSAKDIGLCATRHEARTIAQARRQSPPTCMLLTFTDQAFLRTANVQSLLHPPPPSVPLRLYSLRIPLATSAPNVIWLLPSDHSEWPPNIGGMSGAGGGGYEGMPAPQVPPPYHTFAPLPRIVELRAPVPHLPMPAHALPPWTPHIPVAGNDPASLRAIRNCRVAGDDRRPWGYKSRAAEATAGAGGATERADNGDMAEGRGETNTDWRGNKRRRGEIEGSRYEWESVPSGGQGGANREGGGRGNGRGSRHWAGSRGRGGKKRAGKGAKRSGAQRGAEWKAPKPLAFPVTCPLCPDVVLTSLPVLQSHMAGRKHQAADAGRAQRGAARGAEAQAGQEQGGHVHDKQGHGGRGHEGEGHGWQGHGGEGHGGEGHWWQGHGEGHGGEGHRGKGHGGKGHGGKGHWGKGHEHWGEGHVGEGHGGKGHGGEGHGGKGHLGEGHGGEGNGGKGHGGEGHWGEGHGGKGFVEKGHADRHRGEGGSGAVNGEDGGGGVGGMGGVQGETGLEHGEHGGYGGQGGHGGHGGYGVHGVHVTRWEWGREKPQVEEWRDGGVKKEQTVEIIDLEEEEKVEKEEEEVEILELDESDKDEVKEEGSDEVPQQGKRARAMGWASVGPPFVGGWCAVCGVTCLNESNYKFHLKGKRHRSARAVSHTAAAAAPAAPVP
ncbi:unnamed protein product [Closterium sp. NIES-65]|nr:unnamed protein product [Closterium sp. NIES-65]